MLDGVSVYVSTKISPTAGSSCLSASRSPTASGPRPRLSTQWPRDGLGISSVLYNVQYRHFGPKITNEWDCILVVLI